MGVVDVENTSGSVEIVRPIDFTRIPAHVAWTAGPTNQLLPLSPAGSLIKFSSSNLPSPEQFTTSFNLCRNLSLFGVYIFSMHATPH